MLLDDDWTSSMFSWLVWGHGQVLGNNYTIVSYYTHIEHMLTFTTHHSHMLSFGSFRLVGTGFGGYQCRLAVSILYRITTGFNYKSDGKDVSGKPFTSHKMMLFLLFKWLTFFKISLSFLNLYSALFVLGRTYKKWCVCSRFIRFYNSVVVDLFCIFSFPFSSMIVLYFFTI